MLQMISGISAMDAHPIASVLSEMPGPALPVTARYPEYEQPSAIETDASSSSACTKMPPYFGSSRRSVSITAVHGELCTPAGSRDVLESIVLCQHIADGKRVTRLERHQRRVHHAFIFAAKFFGDQPFQFVGIEIENL